MASPSHLHTQARVQPRNTYNYTYITFLPGQNKTISHLIQTKANKRNLDIKINNTALPMTTHPKVLGFTLNPKLTYIHNISIHAHKPPKIIKALTTTGWCKQKEVLLSTYKAVMKLALDYASSILDQH